MLRPSHDGRKSMQIKKRNEREGKEERENKGARRMSGERDGRERKEERWVRPGAIKVNTKDGQSRGGSGHL